MDEKWVYEFFIEKGELFLKWFDILERRGMLQAEGLARVLKRHGVSEGRILDLCCGVGRIAIPLAKLGYRVVGVDISPLYVKKAREKAEENWVAGKTRFIVGDARRLKDAVSDEAPFDAVINVWTSIGYFEMEDDIEMFRQAREVTRDGGLLVIADTACKESFIKTRSRLKEVSVTDFGNVIAVEKSIYNPLNSRIETRFTYYERIESPQIHR